MRWGAQESSPASSCRFSRLVLLAPRHLGGPVEWVPTNGARQRMPRTSKKTPFASDGNPFLRTRPLPLPCTPSSESLSALMAVTMSLAQHAGRGKNEHSVGGATGAQTADHESTKFIAAFKWERPSCATCHPPAKPLDGQLPSGFPFKPSTKRGALRHTQKGVGLLKRKEHGFNYLDDTSCLIPIWRASPRPLRL